jgi:nucleotide-binding universal stress UspA family protein
MEQEVGFKKILLATDGTAEAEAAVDATIRLARFTSAHVRVAHVWNLEVHHRQGFWDIETRNEADHLVQQTVDRLVNAGVMAEKELYQADNAHVAVAIAGIAQQFGADLVVIGSRGLSDWQSLFRHSVSHQVLAALDCPVLIVHAESHRALGAPQRILLAVAGGDDVRPAVKAAIAVAQSAPSTVMVVHVAQALLNVQGYAYVESDEEVRTTLESAISPLRAEQIKVESMVLNGSSVANAIAEVAAAWTADLIVVGSSRMRDVASLLLGSVSHGLLHRSDVPVLIAERATR